MHDVIGRNRLIVDQTAYVVRPDDLDRSSLEQRWDRGRRLVADAIGDVPPALAGAYRLLCGLGSHDLSAMRELLGPPAGVHAARQWRDGGYIAALLDYGDYVVSYETGVDDQLRFDAHLEVYGDAASLRVQYDTPYVRHLPTTLVVEETEGDAFTRSVRRPHLKDPYTHELEYFHAMVTTGGDPKTSPEDFVEDLDLFAELIRHAATRLPDQKEELRTRMLTDDDVARFRADGYLLPGRQLFSPEKLDALEAIFNEHLADKGDKLSDELDTPALPRPAAAGLPAQRRGAGHGRAAGRAGHRPVDQPLHLQGAEGGPGHALARGLGVLERPVRHLRPDRHGLAGARARATGRTAACG